MTADPAHATAASELQRSPLADHADELAAGSRKGVVTLRELPLLAQVSLRVADEATRRACGAALGVPLPTVGTATGDGDRSALWLGPDEWLVVGTTGNDAQLVAALRSATAEAHASVVVVSSARTVLELAGPGARDVLDGGCRLDLHPRSFGPGSCAATNVAQAAVLLHQTAPETYRLFVRSSYAWYLAAWLLDGMSEPTLG